MDKVKAGARRARYLEIERLYREGWTFAQIGARLTPPITAQWTGALLREGARRGLYLMPAIHLEQSMRNERRLTDIEVRAALMETARKDQAAKLLGISRAALDGRFGHVVRGVASERHRERRRKRILADYAALARGLGYNPTATDMPRGLIGRVQRYYGSLRRFYASENIEPRDRRRR